METVVALWNARGSCEQPQNAKTESRLRDENECSPLRQLAPHLCQHGLIHAVDEGLDRSCLLAERLAKVLLVELGRQLLGDDRLLQGLSHDQGVTGLRHMHGEIVRRSVCAAHTLRPAVRVVDLRVPAVCRVMRHLVRHVLAEAQARRVNADLDQEQVNASQEIAQRLVCNHALVDRLTNLHARHLGAAGRLCVTIKEVELYVPNVREPLVVLVFGVDEMFYLCHGELAHAKQPRARRDLVTERATDTSRREGDTPVIELEQAREVEEMALSCLRSEETRMLAGGADATCEHQVELYRLRDLVVRVRVPDIVLLAELTELRTGIVVELIR